MKLGLNYSYWNSGPHPFALEAAAEAERLELDSIWTAESYGSDTLTSLAWYGARTTKPRLGTNIAQLWAREPAALAMAAMSMDHLSEGRFILGVGTSGPQVAEGWYGHAFRTPLAREREYIEIIRKIIAREEPVEYDGSFYQLPYQGDDATELGKPLRSIIRPFRKQIPIFLGAQGPKHVEMAAEIGDGWLPLWFAPSLAKEYRESLEAGFGKPGARKGWGDFEILATVDIEIHDDVEVAADALRPLYALYIGGMGAQEANFHRAMFERMGYEDVCSKVTELYLSGQKDEAIASVPTQLVEECALVGPPEKIRDDIAKWEESFVTGILAHQADAQTLRTLYDLMYG